MSRLSDLLQLQDYITEVNKDNSSKLTLWMLSLNFSEDEQLFLAEEIAFIGKIRPNSLDLYASLIFNLSTSGKFPFLMQFIVNNLLITQQYIFLRKLLICGALTFDQISNKIPQEYSLIFAPEFNLLDNYSEYESDFEMGFPFDSLGFAIKYDHVDNMISLIKDSNINQLNVEWSIFEPIQLNKPLVPLAVAALFGAEKCFDKLLKLNAKITDTVYECAIIGGNYSIIEKINAISHLNPTIIDLILQYRRGRLIDQLGQLTLCQCIKNRCYSAATLAFSLNENAINELDEEGLAPLHYAAKINCIGLVRFLITNECQINIKTKLNQTAMHFSCRNSNKTIISLLISNGASIIMQDNDGDTPLHILSKSNNVNLVKFICENYENKGELKAAAEMNNKLGLSPLNIAKENKNFELFGILSML